MTNKYEMMRSIEELSVWFNCCCDEMRPLSTDSFNAKINAFIFKIARRKKVKLPPTFKYLYIWSCCKVFSVYKELLVYSLVISLSLKMIFLLIVFVVNCVYAAKGFSIYMPNVLSCAGDGPVEITSVRVDSKRFAILKL